MTEKVIGFKARSDTGKWNEGDRDGPTYTDFKRRGEGLGYDCDEVVINLSEMGLPQNRTRLFVIFKSTTMNEAIGKIKIETPPKQEHTMIGPLLRTDQGLDTTMAPITEMAPPGKVHNVSQNKQHRK